MLWALFGWLAFATTALSACSSHHPLQTQLVLSGRLGAPMRCFAFAAHHLEHKEHVAHARTCLRRDTRQSKPVAAGEACATAMRVCSSARVITPVWTSRGHARGFCAGLNSRRNGQGGALCCLGEGNLYDRYKSRKCVCCHM